MFAVKQMKYVLPVIYLQMFIVKQFDKLILAFYNCFTLNICFCKGEH